MRRIGFGEAAAGMRQMQRQSQERPEAHLARKEEKKQKRNTEGHRAHSPDRPARRDRYAVVQRVRLGGLAAAELNGRCGTVVGRAPAPDRWGVKLHGVDVSKSIHIRNLFEYFPREEDEREKRNDCFNLFSFPPCSCSLGSGSP
mmetsp:Transcript_94754/g.305890  ORF Transcript_94754/g.305890 Transcript_94754/m.305890 type:complete len:144 (+) Transcript_94754:938-1369(+)